MQHGYEDFKTRVKLLGTEEAKLAKLQSANDPVVQIPQDELLRYRADITATLERLNNFGRNITFWYSFTKDDAKVKLFFRTVSFQRTHFVWKPQC